MKIMYFFLLSAMILICACSQNLEDETLLADQFPQTWELIKMTGSLQTFQLIGEDMNWQEQYIFNSDGTFLKTRFINDDTLSIFGSYIFTKEYGEQSFLLHYEEKSDLIGSCSPQEEYLYFDYNKDNLLSNWWACDGPGLFYKRID